MKILSAKKQAILIYGLATSFLFYKYLVEVSPSVMTHKLMVFFKVGAVGLGNIAASYYYIYFIMQLPMGILLDRFGPRRVITICIFLCALGTLIFALSGTFLTACIGRFFTGFGASVAAIGTLKLITLWFDRKYFALMTGLMMTIGMLGAVGGEAPLSLAIDHFTWQQTLFFLSAFGFVLTVCFWFVVQGEPPYADQELESHKPPLWKSLKIVLSKPQTWWLSLYSGFAFAPITAFGGLWGVPFLEKTYAISHTEAAFSSSLIFIGFAIGAPLFGYLSEKQGKRKPLMIMGTLMAFFILLLITVDIINSLIITQLLLIGFGMSLAAFLLCFSMVREVNPIIFAGTVLGFMNAFDAAISAITDPLIGYVLEFRHMGGIVSDFSTHEYLAAISILIAYLIIALLLLFTIKETHCQQQD